MRELLERLLFLVCWSIIRVNRLYRNIPLEIQGVLFSANLMEPFGKFNRLLEMEWLVEHRVSLDCATKRAVLIFEKDEEVIMIGEYRDYLSNVIFVLMAERLVRKGLRHFWPTCNSTSVDSSVGNIRTVKEFPNIFPEELSSLPPDREVEFDMKLLSGTSPMSIALYCITLKELMKLKA